MRTLEIRCDNCGAIRPMTTRPETWWVVEDQGAVLRTGALDFCSLGCLRTWLDDPHVRAAYAADFPERT